MSTCTECGLGDNLFRDGGALRQQEDGTWKCVACLEGRERGPDALFDPFTGLVRRPPLDLDEYLRVWNAKVEGDPNAEKYMELYEKRRYGQKKQNQ